VRGLRTDELVGYSQQALLVLILGTVCYLIGYYTRWGVAWKRIFPRFVAPFWSRSRVLLLSAGCFATFIVAYSVFQARSGVPLFDFTQLGAGKRVWHGEFTLSWMMRGIEIGFLPILLWFSHAVSARRGWRSLILPLAVLSFVVLLGSRVGQRAAGTYVLVVVLVQFHYFRKRIPTMLFAVVCFAAVIVSNVLLEWRNAPEDQLRTFDVVEEARNPLQALAAHEGERQRFSAAVLIMKAFPEEHGYLLGQSWTSLVVAFVPRWIWPEKVEYFEWQDDRIIWNLIGSPTPPPHYATFYANLSWLGVVLLPILFGMFHRGLYEWLLASGRDRNTVLMYALFLVYFGPSTLNVSNTMQYILPMWVILKFVSRRPDATPETI
jgi:hypothetical protein